MIPVGAAWGFHSRKELEEAGATLVFDHPTELSRFLEKSPIV